MQTKFEIEAISDSIGAEIKRDCFCLGVDVAQNKTGLCLLRADDKYVYIEYLDVISLNKGKHTLHEMVDLYIEDALKKRTEIEKLTKAKQEKLLIIEDCWFGFSVWTVKILAKFAVVVYLVFRKWATHTPDPMQAKTARKRIGFTQDKASKVPTKKQVHEYLEDELDVVIKDPDQADAFVLALAGLVIND